MPGVEREGGEGLLVIAGPQEAQRTIAQALDVLVLGAGLSMADAYDALCELAADAHGSLHDVAVELLSRAHAEAQAGRRQDQR